MARLKLKVGEKELAENHVHHFECAYQVNDIPYLTIAIRDGDSAKESFELADSADFTPGKLVTLNAGVDEAKHLLFSGIVIGTQVVINKSTTQLILIAKGEAVKLLEQPVNYVSDKEIEDGALIKAVAALSSQYAFKDIASLAENKIKHPQFAVFQQTPWQIIFARMIENGAVFCPTPEGDSLINLISFTPDAAAEPFSLHEVIDCQMQFDTQSMIKAIAANTWDVKTQARVEANAVAKNNLKLWDNSEAVLSREPLNLSFIPPLSQEQIQARANADAQYRLLDQSQGWLTVSSVQSVEKVAALKLLNSLQVKAVGSKFAENNLVTGIRHRFSTSNWFIDIELGLPLAKSLNNKSARLPNMPATMAKVADFKENPALPHTLSVMIPALDPALTLNARLVTPFAGKEEGFFFPPDKDAEVMVSFMGGNPSYPMIMGACHNDINIPPIPYAKENLKKGLFVGVAEKQMSLLLGTKEGEESLALMMGKEAPNSLALSAEALVLTSKDKQTLTLSDGVVLGGESDALLKAEKNLMINAGENVTIEAKLTEIK